MNPLQTSARAGALNLRNRLVMAPMTRSRADDATGVPSQHAVTYYRQRAGAGLIVTEGTFPSAMGKGYVRTPGIHTDAQVAAWRRVTEAVHARGGLIVLQLMHTGRISHPSLLPRGATPVAASAVKPAGQTWLATGPADFVTPRPLATHEVAGIVDDFRQAARRAIDAGFDGVELHAASGYLPEQFLSSSTNQRDDRYGGSVENRVRFVVETVQAMADEIGAARVGIKISPEMGFNDINDATPVTTYTHLVQAIAPLGLAYLHVATSPWSIDYHAHLKPLFPGTYLLGGGLTQDSAVQHLNAGCADAVVFGSAYLANPDLLERFIHHAPLNEPQRDTFYSDGPRGYIDYPLARVEPNRALRLHAYGGSEGLRVDAVAAPRPGDGEVLVRVRAAGVNALDWKVRSGLVKDAFPLALPATLGIEFAGEVVEAGPEASALGFAPGTRVFGALGRLGAYTDLLVVPVDRLAAVPDTMDMRAAAALPVAALTAWQALFEDGGLQAGQTVLVHGATGGVGSLAVQWAKRAGARVIATARAAKAAHARQLGADEVIDSASTQALAAIRGVDLALDFIGGDSLQQLWPTLSPTGRVLSTAAPEIAAQAAQGRPGAWFQMRPDAARLAVLAAQVVVGDIALPIGRVVPFTGLAEAIEAAGTARPAGKVVVDFAA